MVHKLKFSPASKKKLCWMLKKFLKLFGGGLGKVAKPSAQRYYNVPKVYKGVTKREVKRMCDIGVLEKLDHWTNSPWAAPTFMQAKKTGDIHVLTDLREVNKNIKHKPFLLPWINDLIQKM